VFADCYSLSVVTLPAGLTEIGVQAFRGCASLSDENGFVIVRDYMTILAKKALYRYLPAS
jgi:hypothetical protein